MKDKHTHSQHTHTPHITASRLLPKTRRHAEDVAAAVDVDAVVALSLSSFVVMSFSVCVRPNEIRPKPIISRRMVFRVSRRSPTFSAVAHLFANASWPVTDAISLRRMCAYVDSPELVSERV